MEKTEKDKKRDNQVVNLRNEISLFNKDLPKGKTNSLGRKTNSFSIGFNMKITFNYISYGTKKGANRKS